MEEVAGPLHGAVQGSRVAHVALDELEIEAGEIAPRALGAYEGADPWPAAIRARATAEPTNPLAPVTRVRPPSITRIFPSPPDKGGEGRGEGGLSTACRTIGTH